MTPSTRFEKMNRRQPQPMTVANKAVWRDKSKSLLVQADLKVQSKKAPWILDSGCTSHMTGDKSKLSNMKTFNGGSVKFGNNDGDKIIGKDSVSLNDGRIKCDNVLYVDGLKHNLLSVRQLCKEGHNVVFSNKDCVIRSIKTGKQIGQGKRTSNNMYVLAEKNTADQDTDIFTKPMAKHVVERLRTLISSH